jgi:hypothetical protein
MRWDLLPKPRDSLKVFNIDWRSSDLDVAMDYILKKGWFLGFGMDMTPISRSGT